MIKTQDMLIIDCLEYVNWDRKLFEHAKSSGLNIIHVTIAYWENTKETHNNFKKWDEHFKKHDDLIMPIHDYCLLYTSPSPRDVEESRMPSSA